MECSYFLYFELCKTLKILSHFKGFYIIVISVAMLEKGKGEALGVFKIRLNEKEYMLIIIEVNCVTDEMEDQKKINLLMLQIVSHLNVAVISCLDLGKSL